VPEWIDLAAAPGRRSSRPSGGAGVRRSRPVRC